jgi:manganese/zinc/iron transport system permease protein
MDDFYVILTGALVAVCCSLLGCFLILRRMAMVGDAISHAVLPGIVIAFLVSGSRESVPVLLGAGATGFLTTFLIEFFHRKAKLQQDAAIGITFTSLFALGVILISAFASKVDLDQDCVLYGEIAYVGLGETGIPHATLLMLAVMVVIILFIVIGYKELLLTAFDPDYAIAIGFSAITWHYALMGMVSLTTVAAFDSVGSILVVSFLIAPAATAYLLTDKLVPMLLIAATAGIISAVGGYGIAVLMDGSIAGAMSAVCGLEFLAAFLLSPSQGIIINKFRNKKTYAVV